MIYEIFDDSSVSTDRNDDAAKNAPDGESGSMTVLRWSESSDSEEMKNDAANEEHNEVTDAIKTDETPIISTMTLTPQLVANYKRADLKRWHDVPCRCTVCKEKFAGPNDLRLHVRQRHPIAQFSDSEITNSVKSYGCGLCFKVFDLFGKLVYHSVAAHVPQLRLRWDFLAHWREADILLSSPHFRFNPFSIWNKNQFQLLRLRERVQWQTAARHPHEFASWKREEFPVQILQPNVHQSMEPETSPYQWSQRFIQIDVPELQWHVSARSECTIDSSHEWTTQICRCSFTNAQKLAKHIAGHTVKDDEQICRICGYTSSRMTLFQAHVASHNPSNNTSVKCNICGETLKSKRLYQVSRCRISRRSRISQLTIFFSFIFRFMCKPTVAIPRSWSSESFLRQTESQLFTIHCIQHFSGAKNGQHRLLTSRSRFDWTTDSTWNAMDRNGTKNKWNKMFMTWNQFQCILTYIP